MLSTMNSSSDCRAPTFLELQEVMARYPYREFRLRALPASEDERP